MDFHNGIPSRQRLIPMTFFVAVGKYGGRLHFDLFWSEKPVEDHAAVKDRAGKLLRGYRTFPLAWYDIPDLALAPYNFKPLQRSGTGGKHFEVQAWVALDFDGEKLVLTVKIMRKNYKLPWKADGSLRQESRTSQQEVQVPQTINDLADQDVILTREVEVWTKTSSHFVTNSTGTCTSRGDYIKNDFDGDVEMDTGKGGEEETKEEHEDETMDDTIEDGEDEIMGDTEEDGEDETMGDTEEDDEY